MSEKLPTLPELRQQIDAIDVQIHELINRRAHCAQLVAEVKKAEDPTITSFYRPEREAQVLQMVMQAGWLIYSLERHRRNKRP